METIETPAQAGQKEKEMINDTMVARLESPFEDDLIQTRAGVGGMQFRYVEAPAYIRRLNEVFGGAWSFEIRQVTETEKGILVLGRLTAGGESKEGFGANNVMDGPDGWQNTYKAAVSDALKLCAKLFGIGLHLYEGDDGRDGDETAPTMATEKQRTLLRTLATDLKPINLDLAKACWASAEDPETLIDHASAMIRNGINAKTEAQAKAAASPA